MTKNTLKALIDFINGAELENRDEVLAELEKDYNRGAELKAQKADEYSAAWEAIRGVLAENKSPLTVADIFNECEKQLPTGFTKGRIQYGLTHTWAEEIVKIDGKPNTYRLK